MTPTYDYLEFRAQAMEHIRNLGDEPNDLKAIEREAQGLMSACQLLYDRARSRQYTSAWDGRDDRETNVPPTDMTWVR